MNLSEWKPIETAPKDCSWVLTYAPVGEYYIDGVDITCRSRQNGEFMSNIQPTHWMPLPKAPEGIKE